MISSLADLRARVHSSTALLAQLAAVLSLLWGSGSCAAPKTDVVILVNGDRITGEVKLLERGILSYSTDFMGTINIEWERVAQLQSGQLLEIELMDGSRAYGRPKQLGDPGSLALEGEAEDGVRQVSLDEAVRMAALDEGRLRDRVDGYLSVGLSAASATDVSQLSVGAGVTYRDEIRLWDLEYDGATSKSESEPSSTSHTLGVEQRRFLRGRWFWSGAGSFESNDELGLDLRTLLGGGFGRYFVQSAHQELGAAIGLAVTREEFADGQTQESIEGVLQGIYDLFRFEDPEVDISAEVKVFPSFTVSDRVRTNAKATISYEFIKDFTYRLSVSHAYDSEPQSVGAVKADWSFFTSLAYEF